jgi:hypothetical protein
LDELISDSESDMELAEKRIKQHGLIAGVVLLSTVRGPITP